MTRIQAREIRRYKIDTMTVDYEQRMDKLFQPDGGLWTHRTLRTLFDIGSSEWYETGMAQKIEILDKVSRHESIKLLATEFRRRYHDRQSDQELIWALCSLLEGALRSATGRGEGMEGIPE